PSVQRATAHHHRARVGRRDQRVGFVGLDADHEPALPARGDGHVAAHEEREPAEHALLGDAGLLADELANAIRQLLVVRHRAIVRRMTRAPAGYCWYPSTTPSGRTAASSGSCPALRRARR